MPRTPRQSTSTTPMSSSRTPPSRPSSSKIYPVSHIIARSLEKGYSSSGRLEYQYLVRWEGYGPQDDTWEMRSNLLNGSSLLLRQFDSKPHPFSVMETSETHVLVRYGHESPFNQLIWETPAKLRRRTHLCPAQVELALNPLPVITDGRRFKRKSSGKTWTRQYLVNSEWMSRQQIVSAYGEVGRKGLADYLAGLNKSDVPEDIKPSAYELERLERIAQNKSLMQKLGL